MEIIATLLGAAAGTCVALCLAYRFFFRVPRQNPAPARPWLRPTCSGGGGHDWEIGPWWYIRLPDRGRIDTCLRCGAKRYMVAPYLESWEEVSEATFAGWRE